MKIYYVPKSETDIVDDENLFAKFQVLLERDKFHKEDEDNDIEPEL